MCDTLVTKDGIEIGSISQARRYGLAVPGTAEHPYHGAEWCLCEVDLEALLESHPSTWREGYTASGFGWSEVGADGRTWEEGFDTSSPSPSHPSVTLVTRSDGRREMTLAEWEAGQNLQEGAPR